MNAGDEYPHGAARANALKGTGELLALGISHKTAAVALRERLAFTEAQSLELARQLTAGPQIEEAVAICTCNRTEVYLVVADPVAAETEVLGMLAQRAGIRPTELAQQIYSPRNCDAARQLYRVTAGLESMILGEAEIQGQVKRAYESALAAGVTGPLLNRLFAAALTTGKRVRAETGIAASRVSVPSVAVDLAQDVLGSLADRHVVILGAGEMSELTAQALARQGAGTIFVANRHADRALSLAQRFGGSVVGLDGLPEQLLRADIVVSSTSSPHPIVGAEEVELVMAQRRERARGAERSEGAEPGRRGRGERERSERERGDQDERGERRGRDLLLIDIAVPRDVEAACGDVEGVTLYDIDDLQAVVERNLGARAEIVPQAEEIVEEEIHRFARWLGQAETLPTVAALREHADALVEQILKENAGRWESASERDLMRVEAIARAVVARLLHEPTIRLRSLSRERARAGALSREGSHAGGHVILQLVRELFGLDTPQGGAPHSGAHPEGHTLKGAPLRAPPMAGGRQASKQASDSPAHGEPADDGAEAKLAEVRSIGSARKG